MSPTSLDALKYLTAYVHGQTDWAVDYISGNVYFGLSDDDAGRVETVLDDPMDAISELPKRMLEVVQAIEPGFTIRSGTYSDGRPVQSMIVIEEGLVCPYLWHYDIDKVEAETLTGTLCADPGQYKGTYEIKILPPQSFDVTIKPAKFVYHAEPVEAIGNGVASVRLGEFEGGPEFIALDIGDSVERRTVYIEPDEAGVLGRVLLEFEKSGEAK
ncbi:hypothetical protein RQN9TF_17955 [Rhodococcus qingshengii]|uniref:hypothetical protein n=1 Tax=Rhodococcus TaxID=1827 RepID=UPI000F61B314|nr:MULTISPECIES: hypothetical protein [Rhodococcus]AZI62761.1 hypothetical protein EHW12_17510 [Rhodococcus sp. NJ-530]BDQ21101.1 hypothetical protein RQN9TF_17955 [Rhodococcus qingshengii]